MITIRRYWGLILLWAFETFFAIISCVCFERPYMIPLVIIRVAYLVIAFYAAGRSDERRADLAREEA